MSFFKNASDAASSTDSLEAFVQDHFEELQDFYLSTFDIIQDAFDDIESFVLLKHNFYSTLDFSNILNRSFLLMMFDLAVRLNMQSGVAQLASIIKEQNIKITSRMEAGLLFTYPRPNTAEDFINIFDNICKKIQSAINEEEDSKNSSLITFLNYYNAAVDSLHFTKASLVKDKLRDAINANRYPFLKDIAKMGICQIDITNRATAVELIQQIIDSFNNKNEIVIQQEPVDDFLIEKGTKYAEWVNYREINFDSIRQYAVEHSSGNFNVGRGVTPITEEIALYDYLKSFGNMHKAKFLSALQNPFPQQFDKPLTIIDWGCGQALASMLFCEKYRHADINQIILIEPSTLAIKRAALHCKAINPKCSIKTICKTLDEVKPSDITITNNVVVHLFSNILDIDNYSTSHILSLMDGIIKEENYYVCVSPYISDIKTNKINLFRRHFQEKPEYKNFHSVDNTKTNTFWMCNNFYTSRVQHHGGSQYCGIYNNNGCDKKWTRVLRVFKV